MPLTSRHYAFGKRDGMRVTALYPRPEGRGFTALFDKIVVLKSSNDERFSALDERFSDFGIIKYINQ